jgi:bifunctional DNA-binding transcriptional regulator/antitoxin component of YhaV-PrlF toxin-antitoxin module
VAHQRGPSGGRLRRNALLRGHIPRELRREAGLQPDTPLEVRWRDGEIEPQPLPVTLGRRGRLLVARPKASVEPLRASVVERTRRRINER